MIQGFPPISATDARCLILGSMPGTSSLQATQYYAHPRNQFWPIMLELLHGRRDWDYPQRCQMLRQHGIALWDVVHRCQRQGSLDAAIQTNSMIINDFDTFFGAHPGIELICFNGSTAASYFRRWVKPQRIRNFRYLQLPSTSPAHAALNLNAKLEQWQQLTRWLNATPDHAE